MVLGRSHLDMLKQAVPHSRKNEDMTLCRKCDRRYYLSIDIVQGKYLASELMVIRIAPTRTPKTLPEFQKPPTKTYPTVGTPNILSSTPSIVASTIGRSSMLQEQ